jgi:hypothetical protein
MRIMSALVALLLLAACGASDSALRATSMPNPTNVPATPGPSPTALPAYPAPYPAPLALATFEPHFTARWDSSISATIQWTQSGRGCLYKETALHERGFIGCYEKAGTITILLGGPQTDGAYRPLAGDVYGRVCADDGGPELSRPAHWAVAVPCDVPVASRLRSGVY